MAVHLLKTKHAADKFKKHQAKYNTYLFDAGIQGQLYEFRL